MRGASGWLIAALAASLTAAACGEEEDVAIYTATLFPVNPQETLMIPSGMAEVIMHGDDETMEINLRGAGLDGVPHPSFLWSGGTCPRRTADTNADGLVDVREGQVAYGGILLTLDGNLSTRTLEPGTFPYGTTPLYGGSGNVRDVLNAVAGPDPNPNDMMVSLDEGEYLDLDTRTIVVHGVALGVVVARPLVAGMEGMTIPATVPVLCGRLSRLP